ncbi:hypothetical protein CFO_g5181 [Ceratocystis platani]|uniref:Transcription factor RfeG n=1 Tax=Ceratocystis fimbriata f. sp. platani TaxID=88771 RepID=A0A0F8D8L7_CERFI|nr:hypothetical protein CFO_g5181 [Ceratocystis platani]
MTIQSNVPTRHNEYFIDRDGIDREVITADICRYLGNDALVRPGVFEDPSNGQQRQGYFITAYRNLTTAMIEDLKNDSIRWEREKERANMASRKGYRNLGSPVHGANGSNNAGGNNNNCNNPSNNSNNNGSANGGVANGGSFKGHSLNNANTNIHNGPRRSNSPKTNSIAAPPPHPPQTPHGSSYQSSSTYSQRPEMPPPMNNGGMPPHDYPDRRDAHDAPRYSGHHPQQYPGSAPPSGYGHPPPPPPPNGYTPQADQSYPGGPYPPPPPPPPSMSSYSAPPTQAPYGAPPAPMPEYGQQPPYIPPGPNHPANHPANVYPHDRMGASAPPPQSGYAAGQPPSYPPAPSGYQPPYPPPAGPNGGPSHYDAMKPPPPMDPMYSRNSYQDRTNSPPSNNGPAPIPGDRQAPPMPSKSPQNYHNPYADARGPYSQPSRA